MLRLHRDVGTAASLFILLFMLTGAGVVFGSSSRALLNTLFSQASPPFEKPVVQIDRAIKPPSAAMIQAVRASFPDAGLMSWSPPGASSAVHFFRVRQPAEVHPYGRTMIYANALNGQVIAERDATAAPRGERMAQWLYPLHAAHVGGWPYRFLAVLTALLLAAMSISGAISFFKRPARK